MRIHRQPGSRARPSLSDTSLLFWVIAALFATFLLTWWFFERMYA
jgi:hypothetical protein